MAEKTEQKPNRLLLPNTYQSPNFYVDALLCLLTGEEWKCMSFLIRKTLGWQKRRDRLARTVIAKAAGISESTVDTCMANLVSFGLAKRTDGNNPANEGIEYEVQTEDSLINWEALAKRKVQLSNRNLKRTKSAREASSIKRKNGGMDVGQSTPKSGGMDVPQSGGVNVGQSGGINVGHQTQNPIKPNLKVGALAPQPAWDPAWALAAGQIPQPPTEAELQAAKLADAVNMFNANYQELAKAFILATGIFPLEKDISGWSLAFKDQIARTGLSPADITTACQNMTSDKLTIKDPFSVVGVAGNLHTASKRISGTKEAKALPANDWRMQIKL